MPSRIEVVNWGKFQHYKNRNPPWIKLHRALLDNREWNALSGDASKLLSECWLLASEYDEGVIPMDARDLAWRLRRSDVALVERCLQELTECGFVRIVEQDASAVLAARKQDATPEAEAEESAEAEDTTPNGVGAGAPRDEEADEDAFRNARGEIAGAVRKHAWVDGRPPSVPKRPKWGMENELSVARELLKQFGAHELVGGIECFRAVHAVPEGQPWSLAWSYKEGERWRMVLAVEEWRSRQVEGADVGALVHDIASRLGGRDAA